MYDSTFYALLTSRTIPHWQEISEVWWETRQMRPHTDLGQAGRVLSGHQCGRTDTGTISPSPRC